MNLDYNKINKITINKPLKLDCGVTLDKFDIAYETYGKLDESKSNAILVFHALSGDQFVTGIKRLLAEKAGGIMLLVQIYQLIQKNIL